MSAIEVLEGVFEELVAQHPELRRKRVRIIVLPEAIEPIGGVPTLSEQLKPWIGCIDAPDAPAADQVNEVFLQTLAEKHSHANP